MPVYPYDPQIAGPYMQCIGPMYQPVFFFPRFTDGTH
jgi:hypothetical protein